jgi:hypothetical protein
MRISKKVLKKALKSDNSLVAIMAIGLVIIAILGLTMPGPKQTVKTISSQSSSDDGVVAAASVTETGGTTSTNAASSNQTKPASQSATQVSSNNGQILTAASTAASTPAPVPNPNDTCQVNGRVVVPQGGRSCSFVTYMPDGSTVQWYPPILYAFADGAGAFENQSAPVYVVIESQVDPSAPIIASRITFHYYAAPSATLGNYTETSYSLAFSMVGPNGTPIYADSPQQLTIVAKN